MKLNKLLFSDNSACNNKHQLEQLSKREINPTDFIRRGQINGYVDEMSEELVGKFDKWISDESKLDAGFPRKI